MANLESTSLSMRDNLLHGKTSKGEETIVFPITRYQNILGSPNMISSVENYHGSPFVLYNTDNVDVPLETLTAIFGDIF